MGRTVPSNPVISPSQKRDARAKRAKQTVNKDIPALLSAYPRARKGVEDAEVFGKVGSGASRRALTEDGHGNDVAGKDVSNSGQSKSRGKGRKKSIGHGSRGTSMNDDEDIDHPRKLASDIATDIPTTAGETRSIHQHEGATLVNEQPQSSTTSPRPPRIRVRVADTLDAAHDLLASLSTSSKSKSQQSHVTILNMCSPLRPGGGFLTGATSQEESLCMRTTLYPSLREEFYRLPEVGGVYTPDVLVFRGSDANATDLVKNERWWCDVVSAGMLRFPDVEIGEDGETRYVNAKDRESVEEKMRSVMRIVHDKSRGKKKEGRGLILGAWGCGAYENPVREVAECWKRVLIGDIDDGEGVKKVKSEKAGREAADLITEREGWSDMEIIFAIKERKMAAQFARYFGEDIEVEIDEEQDGDDGISQENDSESQDAELQAKIAELTSRIATSRSDMQRAMLTKMLEKLKLNDDEGSED